MDETLKKLAPNLLRSEADSRPVVVMMCGIAGAGKSTLSKAILSTHPSFERLSIDTTIAAKHGIYAVDYPPEKSAEYQDEAADECESRLVSLLAQGVKDVVVDMSFYSKDDRAHYRRLVEEHDGRCVLIYLRAASKEVLWQRILQRRRNGINADSAYEITEEIIDAYWSGFEAPVGEGEIIIEVQ
ncbi:Uu.00g140990.m01.CDS01 [Anthostomella pinea]|uniref:Uu.00g140990.m01.CDS01 n=1 Tax=Anthostomella pinea TaxID=933095 RepID=A0AAI8VR41_9PEZI|nr:Uu.00g140990.m01.CDS01 [Anthostomella pinea]